MKLHAPSLRAAVAAALTLALMGACTTEPATGPLDTGADPGQTDTGQSDEGATDPGTSDPGTTDPGTTDEGPTDQGLADPGSADAGDVGADAMADGSADGALTDGEAGDAIGDTGPDVPTGPSCEPACGDGEFCAATDTCLNACEGNFDAAAVVASLGQGWTPTGNLCGGGVGAYAFQPLSTAAVLELRGMDGDPLSTLNVDRVTWDAGVPNAQLISATTVPGSIDAFAAFPSLYLELDGAASILIYGYTGLFDIATLTAPGALFVGSLADPGSAPLYTVDAPSNFSVAAIDADSWLVSSAGAASTNDGTGAYLLDAAEGSVNATQVATNLGYANGFVAVHGDLALVGGYADPWPDACGETAVEPPAGGNRAFAFSLAALQQAAVDGAPLDAYCTAPSIDLGSEFRFLPDGRVLRYTLDPTTFQTAAIDVLTLSFDASAGTLAITGTTALTVDAGFSAAKGIPGASAIMLRHEAGYLLVEPSDG